MMQALEPNQWTPVKAAAVKEIIAACAGLTRLEALPKTKRQLGTTLKLKLGSNKQKCHSHGID
jgi:hypothetical protein